MPNLRILSGGAAHGLVRTLQPAFEARHGCTVEGRYGAVGAMRETLLAGEPCDLLILTEALIRELGAQGRVEATSARAIGMVETGVALKPGRAAVPLLATSDDLRAVLAAASAIYFPDPAKATAGIHFMKVLQALGLAASHAERFRTFPNGATAMAALAYDADVTAVGCTQVTEILITPGVQLAGLLPPPHGLATVYMGAVVSAAAQPGLASALLAELAGPEAAAARRAAGFS